MFIHIISSKNVNSYHQIFSQPAQQVFSYRQYIDVFLAIRSNSDSSLNTRASQTFPAYVRPWFTQYVYQKETGSGCNQESLTQRKHQATIKRLNLSWEEPFSKNLTILCQYFLPIKVYKWSCFTLLLCHLYLVEASDNILKSQFHETHLINTT